MIEGIVVERFGLPAKFHTGVELVDRYTALHASFRMTPSTELCPFCHDPMIEVHGDLYRITRLLERRPDGGSNAEGQRVPADRRVFNCAPCRQTFVGLREGHGVA